MNKDTVTHVIAETHGQNYERRKGTYNPYYVPGVKEMAEVHHLRGLATPWFARKHFCFFVSSEELQDANFSGCVLLQSSSGQFWRSSSLSAGSIESFASHNLKTPSQRTPENRPRKTPERSLPTEITACNNARNNFGKLVDHFYTFVATIKGLNVLATHTFARH